MTAARISRAVVGSISGHSSSSSWICSGTLARSKNSAVGARYGPCGPPWLPPTASAEPERRAGGGADTTGIDAGAWAHIGQHCRQPTALLGLGIEAAAEIGIRARRRDFARFVVRLQQRPWHDRFSPCRRASAVPVNRARRARRLGPKQFGRLDPPVAAHIAHAGQPAASDRAQHRRLARGRTRFAGARSV